MVARAYAGLGPPDVAVRAFDQLKPHVAALYSLRGACQPLGLDYMAFGIALDGLQTAAFHFTRRPSFYHQLEVARPAYWGDNGRLRERTEAIATFEALTPYANALRSMQGGCRPFGRDYLAIGIARQSLDTTGFHFTREAHFYGARFDSAGPIRPPR